MNAPLIPPDSYFKLYEKHLSTVKTSELEVDVSDEIIDYVMEICDKSGASFDAVVGGLLQLYIDGQTKLVDDLVDDINKLPKSMKEEVINRIK